jgi:uncharacterized membrane protein
MTETPVPTAPKPATGRGLRIALAVSVALNLAVAGVVVGAVLRGGPHRDMVRNLDFGPFTEALSPGDRSALRRDFFARAPDMRDLRKGMREDLDGMLTALRATPFDADALRAAMEKQGQHTTDRLKMGQDLIFNRIAAMSDQDRASFADRLESRLMRGPRNGN